MCFVPRRTIACERVLEEEGVLGDVAIGEARDKGIARVRRVMELVRGRLGQTQFAQDDDSGSAAPWLTACFLLDPPPPALGLV